MKKLMLALATLFLLAPSPALSHQTLTVGEGDDQYKITVGYVNEPPVTEMMNGLDLIIRTIDDEPVEHLENSLSAEIIAPDGEATRELSLRPQYNQPGRYTDDFILTEPGIYTFHISGFINETEVDLTIPYEHEVVPASGLRFP